MKLFLMMIVSVLALSSAAFAFDGHGVEKLSVVSGGAVKIVGFVKGVDDAVNPRIVDFRKWGTSDESGEVSGPCFQTLPGGCISMRASVDANKFEAGYEPYLSGGAFICACLIPEG